MRLIVNTFPVPPNKRTMSPAKSSPPPPQKGGQHRCQVQHVGEDAVGLPVVPWLFKIEYRVPPPMPIISPLPLIKL